MSLKEKLVEHIRENGPMTVAEYMGACLYDPEDGYYATRPAIGGANADFLTAPEASQMFGELIGLWCAHEWDLLGKPAFNLIELGPGRGVLMQDVLRATQRLEGFHDAANIVLVETSAPLRDEQADRIPDAEWALRLDDAPPGPSLIIGNEFLDCMPIRQFIAGEEGWHEKLVGLDEADQLVFGLSAAIPAPDSEDEPGTVREIAPALEALIYEIERRLHEAPARVLLIDYGYVRPEGADTLQALKNHKKVDRTETPGEADLTAHVDFARVAQLAEQAGLAVHGPITQAQFLRGLGIEVRHDTLAQANPAHAERLKRELNRLIGADQMGALFKVICLSSPNLPPPAGF
ncbi:class I SAM-dependent methyltransferase [Terricaulis sp.]|uniref:class I SAM-dependent methyltransferase n=1 Tax=Terricaulis sp. TaxID=2768686 RepID=UPI002AC50CC8|nr:SAM-dependent methyltransferase [Terricaulis sp.]MDZ4689780.1 SAM-dependent methyltransferase [Terricaulis sp.]